MRSTGISAGPAVAAEPPVLGAGLVPYDRPIGHTFEFQFAPTHEAASRARQDVRRWLDEARVPAPVTADVELIVAELASNAVEQEPHPPVRLDVAIEDGAIYLTVANRSDASILDLPDPSSGSASDGLADRGWGLAIVTTLADGVWVHHDDGWTSITCLKRVLDPG